MVPVATLETKYRRWGTLNMGILYIYLVFRFFFFLGGGLHDDDDDDDDDDFILIYIATSNYALSALQLLKHELRYRFCSHRQTFTQQPL